MTILTLWLWPLLALVLLPGLLVYLGLHVVERGVIFVDLASPRSRPSASPWRCCWDRIRCTTGSPT